MALSLMLMEKTTIFSDHPLRKEQMNLTFPAMNGWLLSLSITAIHNPVTTKALGAKTAKIEIGAHGKSIIRRYSMKTENMRDTHIVGVH